MRIQHNIMALNSYRNYTNNTKSLSKNLEKLSSGYRINRAGDDAAGLAISEKMRAQVTGLEAAQKNAKDGISLVQTAEGALTEVHSMLNRMVDLADQSANGTYDNTTDRANLQKEISALQGEIDRIADSTNFNGIKLLDGSLGGKSDFAGKISMVDTKAVTASTKTGAMAAGGKATAKDDEFSFTVSWMEGNAQKSATVSFKADSATLMKSADGSEYAITAAGVSKGEMNNAIIAELQKNSDFKAAFNVADVSDKLTFTSKGVGAAGAKVTSIGSSSTASSGFATALATGGLKSTTAADTVEGLNQSQKLDLSKANILSAAGTTVPTAEDVKDAIFEVGGKKFVFAASTALDSNLTAVGDDVTVIKLKGATYAAADDAANVAATISRVSGVKFEAATAANTGAGIAVGDIVYKGTGTLSTGGKGLTLQIGDTAEDFNQLTVSVGDMHTSSLGVNKVDISTQDGAKAAVNVIRDAINSVSSTRGDLGALQNRLDHTINNLSVMAENITDAEANIRDVDVAKEMMAYTKNNILVQSAQAMLAQANQIPQGVLQLLQ